MINYDDLRLDKEVNYFIIFCMRYIICNPSKSSLQTNSGSSQLTSGRNWISSPRCCFSHGKISKRSM